jgi:GntR family transcriptional regulator
MQLALYIKMQIQAGIFKIGERVLAEDELCGTLNISRTTVRLAMNRLVEEGLIIRYRGKGSFIADQKLRRNINYMYNFTENMRNMGVAPSSVVLESKVMQADSGIAQKMRLPEENSRVFCLKRVRCANGIPLLIEITYIPYYLCNGIESFDFTRLSLYEMLKNKYSLNMYHAVETIEAILIDKETAVRLGCKSRMPGYSIERLSYLDAGYIFEYTTSVTRADKCIFRLDLYCNAGNAKPIDFERRMNP